MVAFAVAGKLVSRRIEVGRSLAAAALTIALVWRVRALEIAFQPVVRVCRIAHRLRCATLRRPRAAGGRPLSTRRAARLRAAILVSPCAALLGLRPPRSPAFHFHSGIR